MFEDLLGTNIAFLSALMGVLWLTVIGFIGMYIYISFAFMAIGKRAKHSSPEIAWIPIVGPLLITSKTAKMHWWPIILLLTYWIPIVGPLASLVLFVFSIVWLWKTFDVIKVTNWWAILYIIPIVNLVIIGIAAWKK